MTAFHERLAVTTSALQECTVVKANGNALGRRIHITVRFSALCIKKRLTIANKIIGEVRNYTYFSMIMTASYGHECLLLNFLKKFIA